MRKERARPSVGGDHLHDQPARTVGGLQQAIVGRGCPRDARDDGAERLGDERHR
jgi:hypothetical protein